MKIFSIIGLTLLLTACAQMNPENPAGEQQTQEKTYWVNSWQRSCQGVGERLCLQVQKVSQDNQKQPDINSWQLFYASIEGFDYQLGHVYKIKVKETQIPPAQVPADASSIRYGLIDILEKSADDTIRLHDIWALTELNGENIVTPSLSKQGQPQPGMEVNLTKMRVFGSDGCNGYFGSINVMGQNRLKFSEIASTLKACEDMSIADNFYQAMNHVAHYKLSGLTLKLQDAENKTLLQFKKVD